MGKIKSRRAKAHRPRDVIQNPLNFMLGGLKRIDGERLTDMNSINHASMQAIVQGRGTRDHWDRLVGCMNMANVMCELGTGEQYRAELLAGRDALLVIGRRAAVKGAFTPTGDEMRALNLALEVHDAQLEASRVIDVERASDEVVRRVRSGINTMRVTDAGLPAQATRALEQHA